MHRFAAFLSSPYAPLWGTAVWVGATLAGCGSSDKVGPSDGPGGAAPQDDEQGDSGGRDATGGAESGSGGSDGGGTGCEEKCVEVLPAECVGDDKVRVYEAGTCNAGQCERAHKDTSCDELGCDEQQGACASCEHDCDSGETICMDGEFTTCLPDALGCRTWGPAVACETGGCADEESCSTCSDECDALGATRCHAGEVQSCVGSDEGCLKWSEATSCADPFCADETSCGSCDHGCDTAGETSCSDGEVRTCVRDAEGCRAWSNPASCPDGTCGSERACALSETFCTADEWCWLNPRPHGQTIDTITGSGGDHVVGAMRDLGLMLFDGSTWKQIPPPTREHFFQAVATSGPSDIWACTLRELFHFDGASWTLSDYGDPATCFDLWSYADDAVYAVGAGVVSRFDGTRWWQMPPPGTSGLQAVAGTSPSDLWVAGVDVAHFDGSSWSEQLEDQSFATINDVLRVDANEVWVLDSFSASRFVGGVDNWTLDADGGGTRGFALGLGDAWFIGGGTQHVHFIDDQFVAEPVPPSNLRLDAWGAAPDDVWAVGEYGTLLRYNGAAWAEGRVGAMPHLMDLWVEGQTRLALDIDAQLWQWDGATWAPLAGPPAVFPQSFSATGADDIWICIWDRVLHYDGEGFEEHVPPFSGGMRDIFAVGRDDVWVTSSSGEVLHYDGNEWSVEDLTDASQGLVAVHGSASDDVWVVGPCEVFHFDGDGWSKTPISCVSGQNLSTIFALGPDDAWAGGVRSVHHYDGDAWSSAIQVDSNLSIESLWASAPDDVYAVGTLGRIARFNGHEWSVEVSGSRAEWSAVAGTAADDVWVISGAGRTVHKGVAPGPCAGMACSGRGQCLVQGNTPSCECDVGTHAEGLSCVPDPDPCVGFDCGTGGVCFSIAQTPKCGCLQGYALDGPSGKCAILDELSEACSDGQDDDGDGWTDCEDADCRDALACRQEPLGSYVRANGSGNALASLVFADDGTCQRQASSSDPLVNCLWEWQLPTTSRDPTILVLLTDGGSPWESYQVWKRGDRLILSRVGSTATATLDKLTPSNAAGLPDDYVDLGAAEDVVEDELSANDEGRHLRLEAGGALNVRVVSNIDYETAPSALFLWGPIDGTPAVVPPLTTPPDDVTARFSISQSGEYLLLVRAQADRFVEVYRSDAVGVQTRYSFGSMWQSDSFDAEIRGVEVADVDEDGRDDIVATTATGSGPYAHKTLVFLQQAGGTLKPPLVLPLGNNVPDLVVADLLGDDALDIAHGSLRLYQGKGDGTFLDPIQFAAGGTHLAALPRGPGIFDFVGGTGNSWTRSVGNGAGDWSYVFQFDEGMAQPLDIAVGDLDGDAWTDFVVGSEEDDGPAFRVVDGETLVSTRYLVHGGSDVDPDVPAPYTLRIADFLGDATQEILVGHGFEGDIYARQSDGSYRAVSFITPFRAAEPRVLDADGRGRLEVVSLEDLGNFLQVHHKLEGRWDSSQYRPPISGHLTLALGHFNADDCPDAVLGSRYDVLVIAYGQGCAK